MRKKFTRGKKTGQNYYVSALEEKRDQQKPNKVPELLPRIVSQLHGGGDGA
jgi:hypothetical protein